MAIVKALQAMETINMNNNNNNTPRTIMIHRQQDNHGVPQKLRKLKTLREEIRKKTIALEKENWNIEYT
jgi:hypothetical protein